MSLVDFESFYDKFSTKEELQEYLEEKKSTKMAFHLKAFDIYKNQRRTWEDLKYSQIKDLITIRDKDNIKDIIDIIKKDSTGSKNVLLYLDNKTYEDMNLLLSELEGYNVKICYTKNHSKEVNNDVLCTPEDFIGMRAAIDYYKDIIEGEDLSTIEKIMYVYDVVKSFPYEENEEDPMIARNTALVLNNNYMVCLAYCKLMQQILKELGLYARLLLVTDRGEKHARLIMNVNDEEYGIKGLFVFDPTWDSAKKIVKYMNKEGKIGYKRNPEESSYEEGDKILEEIDGLALYLNFMIPACNYKKVYPNSKIEKYETKDNVIEENPSIIKGLEEGLAPKPSRLFDKKTYIKLFYKLKVLEGFPKDKIVEQINELLRLNFGIVTDNTKLINEVIEEETNKKTM